MKKLVLASKSPRRKELMALMDVEFTTVTKDVDETYDDSLAPNEIVEFLAAKKADAVGQELSDQAIVIGSDTIVVLDDEILLKPKDESHAFEMLSRLQGRQHFVYTGLALLDTETGKTIINHKKSEVWVAPMTDEEIRWYIDTKEPMDKAGSYGIQGFGARYIEKIDGDYYTIMGLPVHGLYASLKQLKFDL